MKFIATASELSALYGDPAPAATGKVAQRLTPEYRRWIERARFCVLTTVGPGGTDCSPRGDDGPVVRILDDATLALPDWRGNNRIDSLRNILADGRMSLMFMVPGSDNVIRVNGTARLTADQGLRESFSFAGKLPRTVTVIAIAEVYFQCARALMRSALWTGGDQSEGLPTPGQILASLTRGEVGGPDYDAAWPARASQTMW
ncbi:MAG: pyridoxamine 5'-phosphate oxidase family protein [Paracoccaceae bacterium]